MTMANESRVVCHECDFLVRVPSLATGDRALCPRCNYLLAANRPGALSRALAFSVTGFLFLGLAITFPFIEFRARGSEHSVTLLQSISILATENLPSLVALVFLLVVLVPAVFLTGTIYVSVAVALGRQLPATRFVLRWVILLLPWSMAEIFVIGILVSFIKIVSLAEVTLGLSFWAYALFTVCMVVVTLSLDRRELWNQVRRLVDE